MSYDPRLGNPGDYFFHYTTREAAFQHILPSRQLRLSPAFLMRDPPESNPALVSGGWAVPGDVQAELAIQQVMTQASVELHQLRACSKVLSLTIDALEYEGDAEIFGRGYARARMWEQYAEQHQGVCLMLRRPEFTVSALENDPGPEQVPGPLTDATRSSPNSGIAGVDDHRAPGGSGAAPALPRLQEPPIGLLAARSAVTCKRTRPPLAWRRSHPRRRPLRCRSGRNGAALIAAAMR